MDIIARRYAINQIDQLDERRSFVSNEKNEALPHEQAEIKFLWYFWNLNTVTYK